MQQVTYKVASSLGTPTDHDLVLLASSRAIGIVTAASTRGEEQIVVVAVLVHVGTLLGVSGRGVVGDVVGGAAGGLGAGGVHLDLIDVIVEGTEVHVEGSVGLDEVGVDGIVELAATGHDADGAMVCPGVKLHGCGGGETDGGGLGTESRDRIEAVVGFFDVVEVRGLGLG